jgi:prophage antirepressor-like protein
MKGRTKYASLLFMFKKGGKIMNTKNTVATKGNGLDRSIFATKFELFNKEGLGSVRTVAKSDGTIWFVGADVCKCLGINQAPRAYMRLKPYEKATITASNSGGNNASGVRPVQLVVMSESGLYRLALTSKADQAEKFQDWITQDVLPSIRKNGGYIWNQEALAPDKAEDLARQVRKLATENGALHDYAELREQMWDTLYTENVKLIQQVKDLKDQLNGSGSTASTNNRTFDNDVMFVDPSGLVYSSANDALEAVEAARK